MFKVIFRTSITIIGVLAGVSLIEILNKRHVLSTIFPTLADSFMFTKSVHFAVIFCIAGVFFLASSVFLSSIKKLDYKTESFINKLPPHKTAGLIISLLIGLFFAFLLTPVINALSPEKDNFKTIFILFSYSLICSVITKLSFLPISLFWIKNIGNGDSKNKTENKNQPNDSVIIDTSVIIDGRIINVIEMGFLTDTLIVPDFVLEELQFIADSEEDMRRKKGRRGLDILDKLKKSAPEQVMIQNYKYPKNMSVDNKLLMLSLKSNSKLMTVDFNLAKVAKVKGIRTLNINALASAMRPDFLPGEQIKVKLQKPGKEKGQSVGYLEDGTMIVVQDSLELIGTDVEVEVISSLQTASGKMIFAKRL